MYNQDDYEYTVVSNERTWDEAKAYCDSIDSQLVKITSKEENDVIVQLVASQG